MRRRRLRWAALAAAVLVLLVAGVVSLAVGSHPVAPDRVWQVLVSPDATRDSLVVHDLRLPRSAVAVAVGVALAVAGAVMQALTRNPLADPGILGISAGASLAVVCWVALTGAVGIVAQLPPALVGAAVATLAVQVLAGSGRPGASPARLVLAGVAVSAALTALTQTVILADQHAFNEFRFWVSGSLEGRGWAVLAVVGPLLAAGLLVALVLTPGLNALTLGEDAARALGASPGRTRVWAVVSVTLLSGAATAAVGPIGFVGLAVPVLARWLVGHDHRWVVALSCVIGPAWLLLADSLARVVTTSEVPAGVVAAVVGAPVLIALVSRRKVPSL